MTIVDGFSFISERENACNGRWFCCSAMSAAMTANWHDPTVPATQDTGHFIKSASGRIHCSGMKQSEVRKGLKNAYGLVPDVRIPPSGVTIDAQLDFGAALMVQLVYGRLPKQLRRWSPGFTGGHMAVLVGTDGPRWGWFDPLAPAGWAGEWVTAADILPALWTDEIDGFSRGESDVWRVTDVEAEDWSPTGERKPVRADPDRAGGTVIGYVELGAIVRSIAEAETTDGNRWRLIRHAGTAGWILRDDFTPLVSGGDPKLRQVFDGFLRRTPWTL